MQEDIESFRFKHQRLVLITLIKALVTLPLQPLVTIAHLDINYGFQTMYFKGRLKIIERLGTLNYGAQTKF